MTPPPDASRHASPAHRPAPDPLDTVLALLAHELRNPLAPLRLRVQLARHGRGADLDLERSLDVMDRQIDYLQRMLDDLAAWALMSHATDASPRQVVDLADVARAGQETMAPLATARRLRIDAEPDVGPHLVWGNADRLTQLCINLLGNALKFTGEGGCVTLRLRHRCGRELLQIRDTGDGIASDQLRRIFEPFAKGSASCGLGLGLTVVREVAEAHGGSVSAYSSGERKGSVFTVCLPALGAPRFAARGSGAGR